MTAEQLKAEVLARGNYWTARDQGRLAALEGGRREANPHHASPLPSHDWLAGFDSESSAKEQSNG
jgi:hypothetical protein